MADPGPAPPVGRKLSARVSGAVGDARGSGRKTAMYQLAEGRAYSIAAAPPPGKCDPGGGCPGEYAKNISGSVFDGNATRGGILSAEALGDPPTPNIPSNGTIGTLIDEANKVEEDAIKCEEANEKYGPLTVGEWCVLGTAAVGELDRSEGELLDGETIQNDPLTIFGKLASEFGITIEMMTRWLRELPAEYRDH